MAGTLKEELFYPTLLDWCLLWNYVMLCYVNYVFAKKRYLLT